MTDIHDESQPLSDAVAQRLIARAIELESERGDGTSVGRLREVAREAGIAPATFDDALREFRDGTLALPGDHAIITRQAPARSGFLWRLAQRLIGRPPVAGFEEPSLWSLRGAIEVVATNVIAFAGFWIPSVMALVYLRNVGVLHSGPIDTAAVAVTTALGLVLAYRLRARVTAVILAAGLAGEIVDLIVSLQKVNALHQLSTGAMLMVAAAIGLGLGVLLTRGRNRAPSSGSPTAQAAEGSTGMTALVQHRDNGPFLRLRLGHTGA
ncbi:MAG TPA: hypothetical protein VGM77_06280 [Gemmatimonadales bacterium]|jgi:hypothetical protein